ncbi:hypothetical protein ACW5XF_02245 [Aeromonas lusitana]|uniref:Uncharacterized protein n=1 Tax=Aeromonas lusitana TaxID=931529 RepID=A0A2M8H8I8_9GAMM|nr:hypothetical protein [Aeromonas lusitana]PJC92865.1 hypothetical protein CUC44_12320 [Aeromonas lusitana]
MSAAENYPALLRAQRLQSKSQVPRYWREANQKQREAVCYIAQLSIALAGQALPIGRADRESIRQAVIALGLQHLFHGRMSEYEWHTGCLPELQREEETRSADRLDRKKALLTEIVTGQNTANSGQKKTPINGAANT